MTNLTLEYLRCLSNLWTASTPYFSSRSDRAKTTLYGLHIRLGATRWALWCLCLWGCVDSAHEPDIAEKDDSCPSFDLCDEVFYPEGMERSVEKIRDAFVIHRAEKNETVLSTQHYVREHRDAFSRIRDYVSGQASRLKVVILDPPFTHAPWNAEDHGVYMRLQSCIADALRQGVSRKMIHSKASIYSTRGALFPDSHEDDFFLNWTTAVFGQGTQTSKSRTSEGDTLVFAGNFYPPATSHWSPPESYPAGHERLLMTADLDEVEVER